MNVKSGNGKVKNKKLKAKWHSENQNVKNENGKIKNKNRNLNRKAKWRGENQKVKNKNEISMCPPPPPGFRRFYQGYRLNVFYFLELKSC